jgi:hypothetical protein
MGRDNGFEEHDGRSLAQQLMDEKIDAWVRQLEEEDD